MKSHPRSRIPLLCIATGLFDAAKMFTTLIKIAYLTSLGIDRDAFLTVYGRSTLLSGGIDFLLSTYADAKNRASIIILGFCCLLCGEFGYWLGPSIQAGDNIQQLIFGFTCFELAATLGRLCLTGKLEGWVLSLLPKEEREAGYHQYVITAHRYSSLLSIISTSAGILCAHYMGYRICYGLSLLVYLGSILLFFHLLWTTRDVDHLRKSEPAQEANQQYTNPFWQRSAQLNTLFSAMMRNAKLVITDTFLTPVGLTALAGTCCIGVIRAIVYHQWQFGIFGQDLTRTVRELAYLPLEVALPLLWYNLAAFAGHGLFNEWLGGKQVGQSGYYRRSQQLLCIGALGGLWLGSGLLRDNLLTNLLMFSLLQGATGAVATMHKTLYGSSTRQRLIIGSTSLLIFISRCLNSEVVTPWLKKHAQGAHIFLPATVGLLLYYIILRAWEHIRRSRQVIESQQGAAETSLTTTD